jgi:hypothetical protein
MGLWLGNTTSIADYLKILFDKDYRRQREPSVLIQDMSWCCLCGESGPKGSSLGRHLMHSAAHGMDRTFAEITCAASAHQIMSHGEHLVLATHIFVASVPEAEFWVWTQDERAEAENFFAQYPNPKDLNGKIPYTAAIHPSLMVRLKAWSETKFHGLIRNEVIRRPDAVKRSSSGTARYKREK